MQAPARYELLRLSSGHTFRIVRVLLILLVVLGLTACSGTVRLGQAAADDVSRMVGRSADEVVLGQDELSRLTAKYSVSEEAMADVAPSAQSLSSWNTAKRHVDTVYTEAEDSGVASALAGLACEGLTGQILTEEDLVNALGSAAAGMHPNKLFTLRNATIQLHNELAQIAEDGSEEDKAAALWLCYSLGVVS